MEDRPLLAPKVVLAVGAHADDIDFGAAGTLAKWAAAGSEVHYLIVTDGSKGTADHSMTGEQLKAIRLSEQKAAAAIIGAAQTHFLDYEDGLLEITHGLKKDIVRIIRQVRPDTVIVMDPSMVYSVEFNFINHPDHRAAGQAALDAVFPLARDHLSFPDLYTVEHLEPHKTSHVLLINFDNQNFYVDIAATMGQKIEALKQYASQVPDTDQMSERVKQRAAALGRKTGSQYAEGFVRLDVPG